MESKKTPKISNSFMMGGWGGGRLWKKKDVPEMAKNFDSSCRHSTSFNVCVNASKTEVTEKDH